VVLIDGLRLDDYRCRAEASGQRGAIEGWTYDHATDAPLGSVSVVVTPHGYPDDTVTATSDARGDYWFPRCLPESTR
jgi:hypothetical protein